MKTVLVTGANGQLGKSLQQLVTKRNLNDIFVFLPKEDLDIVKTEEIEFVFQKHAPDFVINTAAYTAVDRAEEECEIAEKINILGVKNLLLACEKHKVKIIHISTDYVFSGEKKVPYVENDVTMPINFYGKTKLKAEQSILQSKAESVIVRTSWLFSEYGHNFVKTIVNLAKNKKELRIVANQKGKPTYAYDLAKALLKIVANSSFKKEIYHFANKKECSWYEFAKEIINQSGANCTVNPIKTSDYITLAQRPQYTVLNTKKVEQSLEIEIRTWQEALAECLKNMNN